MKSDPISYNDIIKANSNIRDASLITPAVNSPELSAISDSMVHLKLENLQPTGSFKVRGAINKLLSLTDTEKKTGVVAMSAGNHAQGVAYHAQRLGIPATIIMPLQTPFTKINRTERLGAKVVLEGDSLNDSRRYADELSQRDGLIFVHPYDDEKIIAGQGTVALEFLDQFPDLEVIIVPIGGGGLISGIAIAAHQINPNIEIYGVEAASYPSMRNIIRGLEDKCGGNTVAEGIAVKAAGQLTRKIVDDHVAEIFLAEESAMEQAMQFFLREQRIVVEGAGAAPLAALLANKDKFSGKNIGLIVSGGNVDARLLSTVLLRGLVRDGRLIRLRLSIADQPGQLSRLTEIIGDQGGNIVEVSHQRLFYDVPVKSTEVDISLETRDGEHVREIIDALEEAKYPTRLLSSSADEG